MITMAKGLTSAHVPMGAVVCRDGIYEAFMNGPEHVIELFHGYTYSGHPLAAVAGLATLEAYKEEGIFERVRELDSYFEDALHSCRDLPHVIDVRNLGLMGAIELEPLPGQPGKRGFELMIECYERGLMTRMAMDTFEFSPPLICERTHIDQIFDTVGAVLRERA
jgi:beta-alanine--pyruvate transaminase